MDIGKEELELLFRGLLPAAASFLGALFAMRKVKNDTAFERRLKWCEDTITRLNRAGSAVIWAKGCSSNDALEKALTSYQDLLPFWAQKELYASADALVAMNDAMETMEKLLEDAFESKNLCPKESGECVDKLQKAVLELTVTAREHLGFEKLPLDLIEPNKRFLVYRPGKPEATDAT